MKAGSFLRGVCIGMVAGVAMDMAANPRPKPRRTVVGKTMEKMGNAMDSAIQTVSSMIK
jgi:gas vesicle protein